MRPRRYGAALRPIFSPDSVYPYAALGRDVFGNPAHCRVWYYEPIPPGEGYGRRRGLDYTTRLDDDPRKAHINYQCPCGCMAGILYDRETGPAELGECC